ncbi:major facilitator superfamily domain-containing protein [Amylostereum chailletii]|nr:major facilitator superfamily domain-containing protein [Amylostereum chailletii]
MAAIESDIIEMYRCVHDPDLESIKNSTPSRDVDTTSIKNSLPDVKPSEDVESLPMDVTAHNSVNNSTDALEISEVPDGGYGWVIVAACSVIRSFSVGLVYSWGVIQARLTASHLAPDGTLSFVGSSAASFISFGAFANAHIIRRLGTRNAALLACNFLGGGQVLSGWSTRSVGGLFVTNGVVMGFGVGLAFLTCSALPAQYFLRRRGLANGFVYAGGGIGGGVWTLAINALIDRVGVPWTFLILGFITLAMTLPAAMLLKERTRRAPARIEWRLFLDWKFVLLFVGSGIGTFPLLVPPFFIPLYAASLHASALLASVLLAVFNLSSAVGRIGFGVLCDQIGPITSLGLALALTALSMLAIWPVSTSMAPLGVFIVLNGVGNGGFFSVVPSVVANVYGQARVANALAMVISGWASGYLLGAPIAGWILGAYGGSEAGRAAFRPAIYFAGSLAFVSAVLIFAMRQVAVKRWSLTAFA